MRFYKIISRINYKKKVRKVKVHVVGDREIDREMGEVLCLRELSMKFEEKKKRTLNFSSHLQIEH